MTTTQSAAVAAQDIPFNKQRRDWKKACIIVRFCILPIALLLVFTYLPFFQMCGYSFYKMKYIGTPKFVGMKNFIDIFTRPDLLGTLKLSLYYMAGALIQVALALYLATVLSFKTRGGSFFKGAMFFPYLINGIAIGFIFKFFYTRGYVLDSVLQWCGFAQDQLPYWLKDQKINNWSLVYSSVWRYLGQTMILFIGAIMSIDGSLYEPPRSTARTSGSSSSTSFCRASRQSSCSTSSCRSLVRSPLSRLRTSSPPAPTAPAPSSSRWTRSRTPTRRWASPPPWQWCCSSSS